MRDMGHSLVVEQFQSCDVMKVCYLPSKYVEVRTYNIQDERKSSNPCLCDGCVFFSLLKSSCSLLHSSIDVHKTGCKSSLLHSRVPE